MRRGSEAGFTLIEVLVASAIVITSMGVLMQLFGSGLDRLYRAGEHARIILAERQIVNALSRLNPASAAQGEGDIEGLHYRWKARPASPFLTMYDSTDTLRRQVAMYDVQVVVERPADGEVTFVLKRMGWKSQP